MVKEEEPDYEDLEQSEGSKSEDSAVIGQPGTNKNDASGGETKHLQCHRHHMIVLIQQKTQILSLQSNLNHKHKQMERQQFLHQDKY